MRSATRSINELAADGLNCSGSKCLRLDGQDLQFGDLLDKLHWSLEFAVQAALAVTLGDENMERDKRGTHGKETSPRLTTAKSKCLKC